MAESNFAVEVLQDAAPAAASPEVVIGIDGMSCGGCRSKAERLLTEVNGVTAVEVSLEEKRARVAVCPREGPTAAELVAALTAGSSWAIEVASDSRTAGADTAAVPPGPQVQLQIQGMKCGSCTGKVERLLREVPGVVGAAVDLEGGRATVQLCENEGPGPSPLVAALSGQGFQVRVVADGAPCAEVLLHVYGMKCGGCRGKCERLLNQIDGVVSAVVSLEDKKASPPIPSPHPTRTLPPGLTPPPPYP